MKKIFIYILVLLFIPLVHAEPSATSYWGYVTFDGITKANALITVIDSSGNTVASTTSVQDATYRVVIPWDESSTTQVDEGVASGETITLKVDGRTATTRTIDTKGSTIRLDLTASSSTTSTPGGGGGSSGNGGSGGGGGGGGTSGETTANIEVIEKYDLQISKDALTSYRFTHARSPVSFVNITGNTTIGVITTSIEVLKDTSSLIKAKPEGLVYKNFNIWVGTSGFATPKNIKEALIKFHVENSWMSSNGVSANDIVLLRWDGSNWVKLETRELSKTNDYTIFEAKTTAFSPFAISALKASEPSVSPGTATVTAVTTEIKETPAASPAGKAPGFSIVLAIAGLAVVALRKRR